MEPRIVEHPDLSPGCCLCCGATTGPFYERQTMLFTIPTDEGPRQIEGTIYLCLGNEQNPGCLPAAASHIGGADPWQLRALGDAARARVAELEEELELTRLSLDEAVRNEAPRVVAVSELLAEFGGLQFHAAPAPPAPEPTFGPDLHAAPPAPPHPDSQAHHAVAGVGLSGSHGEREGKAGSGFCLE